MSQLLVSKSGTIHEIELLDHRSDTGVSPCGFSGTPVDESELDDDLDQCSKCYPDESDDADESDADDAGE